MSDDLDDDIDALAPEEPEGQRAQRRRRTRNTVEWVAIVVGALLVALLVKTFLVQAFYIPSLSMYPTLDEGDRVLVNKLSYDLHDINRGDLIVFDRPEETSDGIKDLIKRVIALPGETIETLDGKVYVDGEPLDESYLQPGVRTKARDGGDLDRQRIPAGHVFVMGDNRTNSQDSREFGPISEDDVVGRAFVRVWPITAFDWL